jgi:adenylate kinase
VCEKCGRMYGIDFPPKVNDICDECGGKLFVRTDDTKETLQNRINIYKKNSEPILDYYREKGILRTLDSSGHPEKIVEEVKE